MRACVRLLSVVLVLGSVLACSSPEPAPEAPKGRGGAEGAAAREKTQQDAKAFTAELDENMDRLAEDQEPPAEDDEDTGSSEGEEPR